ncbi:MAG: deoxyribose-phosphate aldolase [Candidatus Atribacteria bacterium]|nr:deoxyribose-phosphate aldolase [Candidatus Atribacteria bacterium]
MDVTCEQIARMIDHSLLRPELTDEDIIQGCEIARKYRVASVCCRPSDIVTAKKILFGTEVKVGAVIGFPHGSNKTETKVFEAQQAMKDGAEELDMVLHIGKLLSREYDYVKKDIQAVVDVAHRNGAIVKVILENYYLIDELKIKGCQLAGEAGADFVKTSTGFAAGGATLADLQLMRQSVSLGVQVKAAGGVRDLDMALKVREAGAIRFGATKTVEIMEECYRRKKVTSSGENPGASRG